MASKRVVVNAPVIIDLYAALDDRRASIAEEVMSWVTAGFVEAYAPRLLVVEVLGVLARYLSEEELELVASSFPPMTLVSEDVFYDEAVRIARRTGSRAADAYYIATALTINGILLTNDRRQKQSARKAGVEAYYLIEEIEIVKQNIPPS